jgi:hypothetical protein
MITKEILCLLSYHWNHIAIELDDGEIYRKALYLMVKTMVSCRFSLKPTRFRPSRTTGQRKAPGSDSREFVGRPKTGSGPVGQFSTMNT